ncbi:hypothetical protein PIB30_027296 [Stylosanthes scabra]|uniref:Uncharacterized protein n=1 Tax=Stylosanthes scabra TaxID=79078 RepID=A0ABU6YCU6_9FABA|nr:hypothetical protein [Stylosanthes scabra]
MVSPTHDSRLPTHSLYIATRPSPPRSCVAPPRARHTHTHPRLSASASHRPFLRRAAGATTFKPSWIFEVHCSLSSSSFESVNHPQQIFKARVSNRHSSRRPTFLFLVLISHGHGFLNGVEASETGKKWTL